MVSMTMINHRNKEFPKFSRTTEQFHSFLSSCENLKKYLFSEIENNGMKYGTIFSLSNLERINLENCELAFDGTFKTIPKLFGQLFIIFVRHRGKHVPTFFALMKNRTRETYDAYIITIKSKIQNFNAINFLSDFG